MDAGNFGVLGELSIRGGLGLLRLATEGRPDEMDAIGVIHFGLKNGIRLLDTGDSYCLDESEAHYGEQLAADALSCWPGPSEEVKVITKVGLVRRKGRWIPNGKPEHIRKSVEGSMKALGQDPLFLLQLHARDPKTPYQETLEALAELQREGKVQHLGLCNVGPHEIQQAQRHFKVETVQNELNILQRKSATDGTVALCRDSGIPFLAYRPIGGYAKVARLTKSIALRALAERHECTPEEMAIAILLDVDDHLIPLMGARRMKSIRSSLEAFDIELDVSDRTAISIQFPFGNDSVEKLEPATTSVTRTGDLEPNQGPSPNPEIVLLMGIQGAGKSELVQSYVEAGYARLNRDQLGGRLDDLVPKLEGLIQAGQNRVVLDNTYPSVTSRAPVVALARRYGIPIRCRHLHTPLNEAHMNIAKRMIERYGMTLGPEEMKAFAKVDPNLPPPQALIRWMSNFEPPTLEEGLDAIDVLPFVRRKNPNHVNKGLLLDVDGTLRITHSGEVYPRHPDDVAVLPGRTEVLQPWIDAGYHLFFVSNQSGIASQRVTHPLVQAAMLRTAEGLQVPITEVVYCPHPSRPVGCYCRKPMPGLGVYLIERHGLDRDSLAMVGDMQSDADFATALGIRFFHADDFFDNHIGPPQ